MENIKDKIQKLLNLATSDNEHEAALALAKATELMNKWNLDQATVQGTKIETTEIYMPFYKWTSENQVLVNLLAKLCDGFCLFGSGNKQQDRFAKILISGRPRDLENFRYLYDFINTKMWKESEKYKLKIRNSNQGKNNLEVKSFRIGFLRKIEEKLIASKHEFFTVNKALVSIDSETKRKEEEDFETILEGFIDKIHTDFGLRLDIKNIFWRGFCSQGDGLCFDFKLEDKEAFEFLTKLNCKNIEHLKDAVNISDVGIEVETVKNSFATHYCHYNTRDINVDIYIKNDTDIKNESLFDLYPESFKNLQEEIRVWYVYRCKEMYYDLEKHYNEVQDLESEQEDLTFSERVDELIDPEMDINKVINLIQDASSLDYTKGETYNLIEKFKEDFNSKYMIVKKNKLGTK